MTLVYKYMFDRKYKQILTSDLIQQNDFLFYGLTIRLYGLFLNLQIKDQNAKKFCRSEKEAPGHPKQYFD